MSKNRLKWSGPAWNANQYKYTGQMPIPTGAPTGAPMAPGAQGGVNVNVKQVCGCCDEDHHRSSRRSGRRSRRS